MRFELGQNELDKLMNSLPKQGIILLRGTLASGKTTLVKNIAKFHGIADKITSPTFSVMQSYSSANGDKIYHYDIYQNGTSALFVNGLFENFYEDGLHLVEWGDDELAKMLTKMGLNFSIIKIQIAKDKRIYEVESA